MQCHLNMVNIYAQGKILKGASRMQHSIEYTIKMHLIHEWMNEIIFDSFDNANDSNLFNLFQIRKIKNSDKRQVYKHFMANVINPLFN